MQDRKSTSQHDWGKQVHSLVLSSIGQRHPTVFSIWSRGIQIVDWIHVTQWLWGRSQGKHPVINQFNVWNFSSTVYPTVKRLDTLQACQLQSSIDATQNWWDRAPCAACPRLWLEIRQRDFPLVTFPCGAQVLWMTTGKSSWQTYNNIDPELRISD